MGLGGHICIRRKCPITGPSDDTRWKILFAGTSCRPWSLLSNKVGRAPLAHPDREAFECFMAQALVGGCSSVELLPTDGIPMAWGPAPGPVRPPRSAPAPRPRASGPGPQVGPGLGGGARGGRCSPHARTHPMAALAPPHLLHRRLPPARCRPYRPAPPATPAGPAGFSLIFIENGRLFKPETVLAWVSRKRGWCFRYTNVKIATLQPCAKLVSSPLTLPPLIMMMMMMMSMTITSLS